MTHSGPSHEAQNVPNSAASLLTNTAHPVKQTCSLIKSLAFYPISTLIKLPEIHAVKLKTWYFNDLNLKCKVSGQKLSISADYVLTATKMYPYKQPV